MVTTINGALGNDVLMGTIGDDFISGFAGNDYIDGGNGRDSLSGGDGDDTLVGGGGVNGFAGTPANGIDGGAGYDVAMYADLQSNYMVNVVLGGAVRITNIATGSFDLLTNVERLEFTDGAVVLVEPTPVTPVFNEIMGTSAKNNLQGTVGDDEIFGLAGKDVIRGGAGDDMIIGGVGADKLWGDAGRDVFVFDQTLVSSNVDDLKDFVHAEDTIALDHAIFTSLTIGALSSDAFVVGKNAATADQHIIYNDAAGKLYYDVDGVGGVAKVMIAILDEQLPLTHNDFMVQ